MHVSACKIKTESFKGLPHTLELGLHDLPGCRNRPYPFSITSMVDIRAIFVASKRKLHVSDLGTVYEDLSIDKVVNQSSRWSGRATCLMILSFAPQCSLAVANYTAFVTIELMGPFRFPRPIFLAVGKGTDSHMFSVGHLFHSWIVHDMHSCSPTNGSALTRTGLLMCTFQLP